MIHSFDRLFEQVIKGHLAYNLQITQSMNLIQNSTGFCNTVPQECDLEKRAPIMVANKRRRRESEGEEEIQRTPVDQACQLFIETAMEVARPFVNKTESPVMATAYAACFNDVTLTNDTDVSDALSLSCFYAILVSHVVGCAINGNVDQRYDSTD
jgi:hypothetical protein